MFLSLPSSLFKKQQKMPSGEDFKKKKMLEPETAHSNTWSLPHFQGQILKCLFTTPRAPAHCNPLESLKDISRSHHCLLLMHCQRRLENEFWSLGAVAGTADELPSIIHSHPLPCRLQFRGVLLCTLPASVGARCGCSRHQFLTHEM